MGLENDNARSDVMSLEYERFHPIRPTDRVLDLGAHLGYFTAEVARRAAWVWAFEPHPANFAALVERCGDLPNVELVNGAASDADGRAVLHECPANNGAHSLFKHGQCSEIEFAVRAYEIGRWVAGLGQQPDFVKIDTEGAEGAIIESLLGHGWRGDLAVETHDGALYWRCRKAVELAGGTFFPATEKVGVCHASIPRPVE